MSSLSSATIESNDDFVLFLDFWGGAARALNQNDLLDGQKHFLDSLTKVSAAHPDLEVVHAGEVAYVYSKDLNPLLQFAFSIFKLMILNGDEISIRPLRAGIAQGTSILRTGSVKTRLGPGNVEAARLEKSALKGMRLFLTKELGERLEKEGEFQVRTSNARGIEHGEINWLLPDPMFPDFLQKTLGDRPLREQLHQLARSWIEANDNYTQQLGASLNELLKWEAKR